MSIADLIRPWYPGALVHNVPVFEGHLFPACGRLLEARSEPVQGAGWLNLRDGATCSDCLYVYDPKLHAEIHTEECDDEDDDE